LINKIYRPGASAVISQVVNLVKMKLMPVLDLNLIYVKKGKGILLKTGNSGP
jgi:hypothetical protein